MPDRLIDRLWPKEPANPEATLGARAIFTRWQRYALLAGFALLVVFRLPRAWVHGRFLDEEATVFLAYAWHHDWLDALFRPFAGYWNVGANATTLLVEKLVRGGIVSLEHAPYCTMAMALVVQLLPAALVLTGRAAWLSHRVAVVAALLVIAIAPGTEEVFLNVLHIQFHLTLCIGLILALSPPDGRVAQVGYGAILFVAPLCGPVAITLLPLFALRAYVDRDRARFIQFAIAAAGAAVQLLLFYGANPTRGHILDPGTLIATLFVRLIAMPVVGFGKSDLLGDAIYESQADGTTFWWWAVGAGVLLFGVLLWAATRRRDAAIWLVLAGLGIASVSFGYGMVLVDPSVLFNISGGERYNFLPLVLLALAMIVMASRPRFAGKHLFAIWCVLFLFEGFVRYPRPIVEVRQGPSWPAEVAAWRRDHNHLLAVWPRPLAADLSDHVRACSPVGPDPSISKDPRYCESGWVAAAVLAQRKTHEENEREP